MVSYRRDAEHTHFPPLNAKYITCSCQLSLEIYSSSEKTSSPFFLLAMRSFFFFRNSAEESLAFFSTFSILFLKEVSACSKRTKPRKKVYSPP